MKASEKYQIVIPIYNGVDLFDIAAPKEVFGWIDTVKDGRAVEVLLVAKSRFKVKTRDGTKIKPDASFKSFKVRRPDLLWIPGGSPKALDKLLSKPNNSYFKYIRKIADTAQYLCSVCEGALLFAQTGLLDGHKITTHWKFYPCLRNYDVELDMSYPAYVKSGNRITGGGISSGVDEAFYVTGLIAGEKAAKKAATIMQYNPKPFFKIEIPDSDCCPVCNFPNSCADCDQ